MDPGLPEVSWLTDTVTDLGALFKSLANYSQGEIAYAKTFDDQLNDGDKEFKDNGVKVVVDKKSYLYLIGTTLDYSGGLNGKGFVFVNPNADRTCGCGESFSL